MTLPSQFGSPSWSELLWTHTWWRHPSPEIAYFSNTYHYFNLFEGICWTACASLVLRRYLRYGHSPLEAWYALAFLVFALTDFREAYALQSWLLWLKLVVLIALARARTLVITRYYPGSRLY